jgi:hypothetical protein
MMTRVVLLSVQPSHHHNMQTARIISLFLILGLVFCTPGRVTRNQNSLLTNIEDEDFRKFYYDLYDQSEENPVNQQSPSDDYPEELKDDISTETQM